jgi:D-serine deaminase-like pyridoxal phosphate-dependent protein
MRIARRSFLKTAAASMAATACGGGESVPATAAAPCDPRGGTCAGLPDAGYFETLKGELNAQFGTPQMLIDLDRLEANAATIVSGAQASRYRIVEKSLPSLDLLAFVSRTTGSNRFLVMHLPFLRAILDGIPGAQVLIGKSQPTKAVMGFLATATADDLERVRFLVDVPGRLNDLVAFAAAQRVQLQVSVEVDVGLHRGGVRTPDALPALLDVFSANPATLKLGGLLGYDGHVAGAPATPGLEEKTIRAAFNTAQDTYQAFKDVLTRQYSALVTDELVFNSGGTDTYSAYPSDGPVNDVAAGGGMLRPSAYASPYLGNLLPASFIAAPVLRHYDRLELPYVTDVSQSLTDDAQGVILYGGGWPANPIYPAGIGLAPFVTDGLGINQVPNQSWCTAPPDPPIGPGDWVFLHPIQGDGIFQFEQLLLVRGGHLTSGTFRPFARRY